MFEIVQADGQKFRFSDEYDWEFFTEESRSSPDFIKEDKTIVQVFHNNEANVERTLVTTFFRPLRVDSVEENTALNPFFRERIRTKCVRCGHVEF